MSNAARKDRKRNNVRHVRKLKSPTPFENRSLTRRQDASLQDAALKIMAAEAREQNDALPVLVEATPEVPCPTCQASGEQPCMTRAGKVTKRHAGRVA